MQTASGQNRKLAAVSQSEGRQTKFLKQDLHLSRVMKFFMTVMRGMQISKEMVKLNAQRISIDFMFARYHLKFRLY